MPESSIHVDILRDNISAAQQHPMCGNWAAGIRVRQPPQIPRGLSPWPLPAERQQGAAPCIARVDQYIVYYIAQNQGANPLSINTLMGGSPQIFEGPVEPWQAL